MAERYGRHAGIVAWQIDNEFGGETKYDYSEAAQRRFQRYLERKFGSIEELNERWGTAFWSQTYRSFEQIPLPVPYDADVMMWPHPSLELEFERFCSRAMADFNALQMETIRRYSNAPLTTNAFMFNWGDNVNWADLFRGSDAVGIDIYSEDPVEIAFYADACRSLLNRPFWVMEYGTSSKTLASEMDLLVGRGCERFSLFKFRLFPWGQEQEAARSALLDVTRHPRPSYFEVQRWATEARAERSPEPLPPSGCGIYYDFDCSWAYRISMHDRKKYFDVIFRDVYASFHMQDRTLQVAFRPEDIEGLKLLALPLQIMHDEALEAALIRFVESGGILIATSDLFRKNRDNVFLDKVPMLFRTLLGWTDSRFVDDVPELAESKEIVLLHGRYGKGRMWLVRRDLDKADWQRLAAEARETLAD
jgi:beta-galactosidase